MTLREARCSFLLVSFSVGDRNYKADAVKAIINLRWSQNPLMLTDGLEKAIAAVTTVTYWATALWYMTQEDKPTSGLLTVVGGLQAWSAFFASK